jgi:hypothetical protein
MLGSLFGIPGMGGGGGGIFGAIFGGFRAGGGEVQAGKAYVVGENRPELFVPSTSGRIEPSVPSSGSVVVNVNNMAPEVEVDVEERHGPDGPQLDLMIRKIVAEDITSGGRVAKAMKGRYGLSPVLRG